MRVQYKSTHECSRYLISIQFNLTTAAPTSDLAVRYYEFRNPTNDAVSALSERTIQVTINKRLKETYQRLSRHPLLLKYLLPTHL